MIGFLLALAAGFVTPHAVEPVARPVANAVRGAIHIEDAELPLVAFMLLMLAVGAIAALIGSGTPFVLMLGAIIGYFATRGMAAARDRFGKS